MRILVACEESQAVTIEMRKLGVEAYSCDILPCSGGHPEWHIQGNVLDHLDQDWDLMIAHPPCTYLSKAGARWMYPKAGILSKDRFEKAMIAKNFFLILLNSPIKMIAVENPTPLKVIGMPTYSQVIQPYEYGDPFSKRTLLWLKNLPKLKPTNVLTEYKPLLPSNTGGAKRGTKATPVSITQKESSKTFRGIAQAMAEQWGTL